MVLQKVGERKFEQNVQIKKLLHKVKEERNILRTIKRKKANWICVRNAFKNSLLKERREK